MKHSVHIVWFSFQTLALMGGVWKLLCLLVSLPSNTKNIENSFLSPRLLVAHCCHEADSPHLSTRLAFGTEGRKLHISLVSERGAGCRADSRGQSRPGSRSLPGCQAVGSERMSELAVDKQWDCSKMRRVGLRNSLHKCFSQLLMKKKKGGKFHKSYQDLLQH